MKSQTLDTCCEQVDIRRKDEGRKKEVTVHNCVGTLRCFLTLKDVVHIVTSELQSADARFL
jgi:hypothetical protein